MRGKVSHTKFFHASDGDHPRLCGEKKWRLKLQLLLPGSPPPMRGKVFFFDTEHLWIRITPAYAGKSHSLFHSTEVEQDHPRLCGEKSATQSAGHLKAGSPPPMRGKVKYHLSFYVSNGITPAYAGKSFKLFRCRFSIWDHPRLCGEKSVFRAISFWCSRITPAYAGKRSTETPCAVK